MTTPKVIETSRSRCGKAAGKLSTSTIGKAPRNPPEVRTTLHAQGTRSGVLRISEAKAQTNSTTILPTFCPWKRPRKAPTALSIPFTTVSLCFTLPDLK
jgi:hypothetical protein